MNKATKIDFDEFASNYREIHNKNIALTGESSDYYSEYKIKEIISYLKNDEKILDFGCGDGISSFYLRKYLPDIEIFGIDISTQSIEEAIKRNIAGAHFESFNGAQINFEEQAFDTIFISCVLHHIEPYNHHLVLKECYRVLKPNGKIFIFEHNPYNPITQKIVKDCVFDRDAILITSKKLREKLLNAGFNDIKSFFTLFLPRQKIFKSLLFLEKYLKWIPLGGQYYIFAKK